MDELHISAAWLTVIAGQISLISVFAIMVFQRGTTKNEIDNVNKILQSHAKTDYIPHLLEGTRQCAYQIGVDNQAIREKHYRVLGIGAIIIFITFMVAAYLGGIKHTTKSINTHDTSFHQATEILSMTPDQWDSEVNGSKKDNPSNQVQTALVLNQDGVEKFRRMIFEENYSWHYEALSMMILLFLSGLPFLWALGIRRRVFRNSAYIAASYAYAGSQVLTNEINNSIRDVEKRFHEHQLNCKNFRA